MHATSLDHVALWTSCRDDLASVVIDVVGFRIIERTETFTLLGGGAREGKLTLFDAEGQRERGALDRIVLRVSDLSAAVAELERRRIRVRGGAGDAEVCADPLGVPIAVVRRPGPPDLDVVALRVADLESTRCALLALGLEPSHERERLTLAGRSVILRQRPPEPTERPLLNHVALLVDSAAQAESEAEASGFRIDRVVDAPNTIAVFVRGPEGIVLEYVEHKPSFALV